MRGCPVAGSPVLPDGGRQVADGVRDVVQGRGERLRGVQDGLAVRLDGTHRGRSIGVAQELQFGGDATERVGDVELIARRPLRRESVQDRGPDRIAAHVDLLEVQVRRED
jgi:hypothetical protein